MSTANSVPAARSAQSNTSPMSARDLCIALAALPAEVFDRLCFATVGDAYDGDGQTAAFNLVQAATAKAKLDEVTRFVRDPSSLPPLPRFDMARFESAVAATIAANGKGPSLSPVCRALLALSKVQLDALSRDLVNDVFDGDSRMDTVLGLINHVVARGALPKLTTAARRVTAAMNSSTPQ